MSEIATSQRVRRGRLAIGLAISAAAVVAAVLAGTWNFILGPG